jgi:hypothetical protein
VCGRSNETRSDARRDPQQGRPAVRTCVLALAVILGGCSASELVQNWTTPPVADLSQPNYRRIVADNIKLIFPNQALLGELEISGVRMVDHLRGAAWLTCLKLDTHGNPQIYAIFIQNDKIIDQRAGVVMDQCHKESYVPLDIPAPTPPAANPKKPAT